MNRADRSLIEMALGQASLTSPEDLAEALRDMGPEARLRLCYQELSSRQDGLQWLRRLIWDSLKAGKLSQSGEYAALLAQLRCGSRWYPSWRDSSLRLPIQESQRALTLPKLQHDIEQMTYLRERSLLPPEFDAIIHDYLAAAERMASRGPAARVPIDDDPVAAHSIGSVYARLVHVRDTPRVKRALSGTWDPQAVEGSYIASAPGIVVIDDFLSAEALHSLYQFCLESTVWSANRYDHGRLGAFYADGFNCPLVLQIAAELSDSLHRVVGRYPLEQLWAFKHGTSLPTLSGTHADFAAVNVNFWITPDSANLGPEPGGMIVYDVDAPLSWGFEIYNVCSDRIQPFLQDRGARAVEIAYRANRAIIFNADLFHATSPTRFRQGYENRRINVTMLFGKREHDIYHPPSSPENQPLTNSRSNVMSGWRSQSFARVRRRMGC